MPKEIEIIFGEGKAAFIHDDDAAEIMEGLGGVTIRRASHVEPGPDNKWYADLSPIGGPKLGPFDRRQQALDDEAAWLKVHHLHCGKCFEATSRSEAIGTTDENPPDRG